MDTPTVRNNYNVALKLAHTGKIEDSYIHIDDASIMALAGPQVGVISNKDTGNTIVGSVGIKAKPENITVAQMYKFNNMMMSLLPSTIYTPIPVFKEGYSDKVDRIGEIMAHVKELKSTLGAFNV